MCIQSQMSALSRYLLCLLKDWQKWMLSKQRCANGNCSFLNGGRSSCVSLLVKKGSGKISTGNGPRGEPLFRQILFLIRNKQGLQYMMPGWEKCSQNLLQVSPRPPGSYSSGSSYASSPHPKEELFFGKQKGQGTRNKAHQCASNTGIFTDSKRPQQWKCGSLKQNKIANLQLLNVSILIKVSYRKNEKGWVKTWEMFGWRSSSSSIHLLLLEVLLVLLQ